MSSLVTTGLFLIGTSVVFALPGLGVGTVIPFVGDVIDIPLAAIAFLVGTIFLLVGGVLAFFVDYWYIALAFFIGYIVLLFAKNYLEDL